MPSELSYKLPFLVIEHLKVFPILLLLNSFLFSTRLVNSKDCFICETEAESAQQVGGLSRGENRGPEADLQRAEIVDPRTVEHERGGLREPRGGVPDRGQLRATMLHDLQRR